MQDPRYAEPSGSHSHIRRDITPRDQAPGTKHHVTGDIVQGMHYESKPYQNPDRSENLHSKELIGYTAASTSPNTFGSVLQGVPAPTKSEGLQRKKKTMRTEPVKSWNPPTFYEPGESRRPLVKCTEWTEQQATPTLHRQGLIRSGYYARYPAVTMRHLASNIQHLTFRRQNWTQLICVPPGREALDDGSVGVPPISLSAVEGSLAVWQFCRSVFCFPLGTLSPRTVGLRRDWTLSNVEMGGAEENGESLSAVYILGTVYSQAFAISPQ